MNGTLLLMIVVPLVSFVISLSLVLVPLLCAAVLHLSDAKWGALRLPRFSAQ